MKKYVKAATGTVTLSQVPKLKDWVNFMNFTRLEHSDLEDDSCTAYAALRGNDVLYFRDYGAGSAPYVEIYYNAGKYVNEVLTPEDEKTFLEDYPDVHKGIQFIELLN